VGEGGRGVLAATLELTALFELLSTRTAEVGRTCEVVTKGSKFRGVPQEQDGRQELGGMLERMHRGPKWCLLQLTWLVVDVEKMIENRWRE